MAKSAESAGLPPILDIAEAALYSYARGEEAIRAASRMRGELLPVVERMSQDDPSFLGRCRRSLLTWALDRALEITRAEMGNIQIFDPASAGLRIEAQRGFGTPFLEFFDCVRDGQTACGLGFKSGRRIIVEDVTNSQVFRSSSVREVMHDAKVGAVQSTPLIGRAGRVLGIVSTHYRRPQQLHGQAWHQLDVVADIAAEWIAQFQPQSHASGIPGRPQPNGRAPRTLTKSQARSESL